MQKVGFKVTKRRKEIFKRLFADHETPQQVAAELGISKSEVVRVKNLVLAE